MNYLSQVLRFFKGNITYSFPVNNSKIRVQISLVIGLCNRIIYCYAVFIGLIEQRMLILYVNTICVNKLCVTT